MRGQPRKGEELANATKPGTGPFCREVNPKGEEPIEGAKSRTVSPVAGVKSRMKRELPVRFREGLGVKFPRATRLVVLCRTESQVHEAADLVQQRLTSLGLTLSAEKTKTTKFREGFAFLGFAISSWSVTMRPKSVEKFKTKIRELTPRHHNLDGRVIVQLNRVIRGTANYFANSFSDVSDRFRGLDRWIRMRLRCMKSKRKSRADNGQYRLAYFRRLGLCSLTALRPAPV